MKQKPLTSFSLLDSPSGICATCWSAYRERPTPLLYCPHLRTLARKTAAGGWKVIKAVSDEELQELGVSA
jgi:hypothetical protein